MSGNKNPGIDRFFMINSQTGLLIYVQYVIQYRTLLDLLFPQIVLRIRIQICMDPHNFGNLDTYPNQIEEKRIQIRFKVKAVEKKQESDWLQIQCRIRILIKV
jgi:hypothetical protein